MDISRIASRVASSGTGKPLNSSVAWMEGYVSPEDVVGSLPRFSGPVWAGLHGFGWVVVDKDPAKIADDEVLQGDRTWAEVKADEDLGAAVLDMKPYPSVDAFAADGQTIRWMCSYDDAARDEFREALTEGGFPEAAARVHAVRF